ncbi:MAG: FAD-dependent thymidylate synthase, partial [Spirochaetia bacterium]|nr:FAD-dependent thymidylate synthase [Spirochaetia bacterium]
EQVSQRYVAIKEGEFYIPPSLQVPGRERALKIYQEAVHHCMQSYNEITEQLKPIVAQEYFRIFPARSKKPEKFESSIHKKAMEAARYIIPVSAYTYLYHTVDGLTLHRYRRLCKSYDVPEETFHLVEAMYRAASEADPLFTGEFQDPLPLEETLEYKFFTGFYETSDSFLMDKTSAENFIKEFDEDLNHNRSILVSHGGNDALFALAFRSVLGISRNEISDEDAIRNILDPAFNPRIASVLNESTMTRLMRSMYHIHYTFKKKISHTADSQDQRHRTVPGSRPFLMRHFTGKPDYITPDLIADSPSVNQYYEESMDKLFRLISDFIDAGGSEEAVYLLPNAFPVRFYESGDLLNLHHKWKTRLCYTAQEEIFNASLDEVKQVSRIHPIIGKFLYAPCKIRHDGGIKPSCPEGDRFCGVRVWEKTLDEYQRLL